MVMRDIALTRTVEYAVSIIDGAVWTHSAITAGLQGRDTPRHGDPLSWRWGRTRDSLAIAQVNARLAAQFDAEFEATMSRMQTEFTNAMLQVLP